MKLTFIRLLFLTPILVLQACSMIQYSDDPTERALLPGEGVVIVSTTLNTNEFTRFNSIQVEKVESLPSGETKVTAYKFGAATLGNTSNTSFFASVLPAGNYRFKMFENAAKYIEYGSNDGLIGKFKVEDGKVSDLGRLVVSSLNTKIIIGRSYTYTNNLEFIDAYLPLYRDTLSLPLINAWDGPPKETDRVEEFAKLHPVGVDGFTELKSGQIIAGSRMGRVLIRNPKGRWKIAPETGTLNAILTTSDYERGDNLAIVGGEMGTLLLLDNTQRFSKIDKGNLPEGSIVFIDHDDDFKNWYVAVSGKDSFGVYQSSEIVGGNWRAIKDVPVKNSRMGPYRSAFWFWRDKQGLGFTAGSAYTVSCYNYNSQTWTENSIPEERIAAQFNTGALNSLGLMTSTKGFDGALGKTHYSTNCGTDWTETSAPYKIKFSAPVLLASGRVVEAGGAYGTGGLHSSSKNGTADTWEKIAEMDMRFERLYVSEQHGVFMITNSKAGWEEIKHSEDDGKTWVLEYSSIDWDLERDR